MTSPNSAISNSSYKRLYPIGEEIANSITHGLGTALSIAGLIVLVLRASSSGNSWQIVSFSIYGTTLVLLYLASTLYHSFQTPKIKRLFQIFDHSAIYLLIAGTYTPFLLVNLRGPWGWSLLTVIWGLTVFGIGIKVLYIDRYQRISVLGYVLLGWLGVVAAKEMIQRLPTMALIWVAVGGFSYTVGILFAAWRRLPYSHTIWHLFVLAGSISHYIAVVNLPPNS